MIRRATMLALALALAGTAWAMNARYSSGDAGIVVGPANTNTPFINNHSGGDSAAFSATEVVVCSRSTSANTCMVDFDGVATTADWRVAPGGCVKAPYLSADTGGTGYAALGSICKAAESAIFDVMAGR